MHGYDQETSFPSRLDVRVRSTRGKRKGLADHGISQTRSQTAGQQLEDFPLLLDCACGAKIGLPSGVCPNEWELSIPPPFQTICAKESQNLIHGRRAFALSSRAFQLNWAAALQPRGGLSRQISCAACSIPYYPFISSHIHFTSKRYPPLPPPTSSHLPY